MIYLGPLYNMAPRRKYQRRFPRRKRVIRRRRQKTTLLNRGLTPFPARYITKMKYSESFNLTIGNGWTQQMNLNSVFDPNRSGVGHQPYGYDQLTPIYNRYRVISCNYVINCYSGGVPIRYGCLPCNEAPPINNMSELVENPRSKWAVQFPAGSTTKISGKVYIPALVGRTKAQYMADDRYQAQVGQNPGELAILFITAQNMSDISADTTLTVTLNYTVEFFDAHPIDQS